MNLQDYCGPDYDWRSNPYLAPGGAADRLQIALPRAVVALWKLYPADVCRALAPDPENQHLVAPLLVPGWHEGVASTLRLGHDLADCRGWEHHPGLIARLRHSAEWDGARHEVGLWAGLARARLSVAPIAASAGQQTPDLIFDERGLRIALEAKAIVDADRDQNQHTLRDAVTEAQMYGGAFGEILCDFVLEPCAALLDDIVTLQPDPFERRHGQRTREALTAFYRRNREAMGQGPIEETIAGLGVVRTSRSATEDSFAVDIALPPDRGLDWRVARALREVRGAALQLSPQPADLRVAAVLVPRWSTPVDDACAVALAEMVSRPAAYQALDYVVLLNSHRRRGPWTTEHAVCALPWARHEIHGMCWPQALTDWKLGM